MSHDRDLVDTIKARFARKSSAELQKSVQANEREPWSPEALAAADEVRQDRKTGRAQEPLAPQKEPPQLPSFPVSPDLAVGSLAAFSWNSQ